MGAEEYSRYLLSESRKKVFHEFLSLLRTNITIKKRRIAARLSKGALREMSLPGRSSSMKGHNNSMRTN